ncbi:MAG TPA: HAMP domain-containing sensor histidine kinase [Actinoplanes sp.]|nr:HAMP domain-containing sensor histidine kinase [Actinoplanes sp.]
MTATAPRPQPSAGRRRFTIGVRARILATVLVLAALGMLVAGTASTVVAERQLTASIDAALKSEVDTFRTHIELALADPDDPTDVRTLLWKALQEQVPTADQAFLAMIDGVPSFITSGDRPFPIERETALIDLIAALPPDSRVRIRQDTTSALGPIRYVAVPVRVEGKQQQGVFVVATSLRQARHDLVRNAEQYALLSVGTLVLIAFGGWLVTGQLLRPLRRLDRAAERISHTDLTARIQVTGNDDITQLTTTVNSMLDRLQQAFDTQQQFLDDAGHELRTPLTVVQGHLEVLDVADPLEVTATRDLVLDELDRMTRLVNDLIMLAQSQRPDFVRFEPVDVDRLLRDVMDKAAALADRRWGLDAVTPLVVEADGQRLTQALLQLADNAVKHTDPEDQITIGGSEVPGGIMLWVRDTGRGVDDADAERIFERFKRAGTSRGADGSGLGLSIVAGIAAAHGGRVRFDHNNPGARFSLVLPLRVVDRTSVRRHGDWEWPSTGQRWADHRVGGVEAARHRRNVVG